MNTRISAFGSDLRLLAALFRQNMRALLADRGVFWTQAGFMAFNNVVFCAIWVIFFGRFRQIGGYDLRALFLMQGLVAAAFGCFVVFFGGGRDLSRRIHEGSLDVWLVHPRSVVVQALGARSLPSGWGDMTTGTLLILWAGGFASPSSAATVLVSLAAAVIAFTACGIGYGALACWVSDSESLMRQVFDFTLTFSLWPERIFGGWLRVALYTVFPAGYIAYLPVSAIREASLPNAFAALGAAVALFAAAVWLLGRGLRRYESGSGFVAPTG